MAAEIALVGSIPMNEERRNLGVFKKTTSSVNRRPTYKMDGYDKVMLWFAGSKWWVGKSEDVGKSKGWIKVKDQAQSPELVTAKWMVYDHASKVWVPAPGLRIIAGAALHAERQAAASTVAVHGATPGNLHQNKMGLYKKRAELVNGWPSYEAAFDSNVAMWHGGLSWFVGPKDSLGTTKGFLSALDGALRPEAISATWKVADGTGAWPDAPDVHIFTRSSPTATASTSAAATAASSSGTTTTDDDGVEVTGERTREQRDAEGRKRAIDLNLLDANKRPRTASTELQTQVAKARSVCTGEVQKRVEELIRPAVADYVVDKIDDAELDRRKAAARAQAESEHAPLSKLDAAFSAYTAAVAARVAAEDEAEKAIAAATAAEDAAAAALQAAVKTLLPSASEAGPSGVVKAEQ